MIDNDEDYIYMIFELYAGNLDGFIRKGEWKDGFDEKVVEEIKKQLIIVMMYLHDKIKIYHADIKTDNILCFHNNTIPW